MNCSDNTRSRLINADSGHPASKDEGFRMVEHYEKRIARLRSDLGVRQY